MSQDIYKGGGTQESAYLKPFLRLAASEMLVLTGDNIYIERLGRIEQKTASGIIIPTETGNSYKEQHKDNVIELGVVLMTGPGDVDADGSRIPMEVSVGDIIEIPMNVKWYSQFMHLKDYKINAIGRMRASQVMVKIRDYEKAMAILNMDTTIIDKGNNLYRDELLTEVKHDENTEVQSGSDQHGGSRGDTLQE